MSKEEEDKKLKFSQRLLMNLWENTGETGTTLSRSQAGMGTLGHLFTLSDYSGEGEELQKQKQYYEKPACHFYTRLFLDFLPDFIRGKHTNYLFFCIFCIFLACLREGLIGVHLVKWQCKLTHVSDYPVHYFHVAHKMMEDALGISFRVEWECIKPLPCFVVSLPPHRPCQPTK